MLLYCLDYLFHRNYNSDASVNTAGRVLLVIYNGIFVEILNIEMTMHQTHQIITEAAFNYRLKNYMIGLVQTVHRSDAIEKQDGRSA